MSPLSPTAEATIASARLRVVDRDRNPLLEDLPSWVTKFRLHQVTAIQEVLDAYSRVPVVILDAPTGSGKTLIAEVVRRLLKSSALYICTTRGLQDQFARDYPYAAVLKGRSNYATENYPERFDPSSWATHLSCDDCTWTEQKPECSWCERKSSCPYELAKNHALSSMLAVLNTSYFLTEANHIGRFSDQSLVIADEADTLEDQLMKYVSVEVSPRRMEKYGWDPPEKVTVPSSWKEWLDEKIPEVDSLVSQLPRNPDDVPTLREQKYLFSLRENLATIRRTLDDGYWVYTGRDDHVAFKPARVDKLGITTLWSHSQRWLLMSATIISSSELVDSLGYAGEYEVVRVPSTFPVENRKVNVWSVGNMAKKTQEAAIGGVVSAANSILARHPDDRVLMHTVSYDIARAIHEGIRAGGRRVLSYSSAADRDRTLSRFCSDGGKASVLVAPSMDRGVDLPGEACRVQVIVKIPYPNLGDRQISARLYGSGRAGQAWYTVQTIRTIVQMCGRAVRSEDDWAVTYILDSQFQQLWSRGRGMFPQWFKEAVVWNRNREIHSLSSSNPQATLSRVE